MKKIALVLVFILLACAVLALGACGDNLKDGEIRITIGNKSFIAKLTNVKAAKELERWLPQTFDMHFNSNGILYVDTGSKTFTEQTDSSDPLYKGDIVLRGNNRLEIYYGFNQPESLTRLGAIKEEYIDAFVEAVKQATADASGRTITVKISK